MGGAKWDYPIHTGEKTETKYQKKWRHKNECAPPKMDLGPEVRYRCSPKIRSGQDLSLAYLVHFFRESLWFQYWQQAPVHPRFRRTGRSAAGTRKGFWQWPLKPSRIGSVPFQIAQRTESKCDINIEIKYFSRTIFFFIFWGGAFYDTDSKGI